MTVLFWQSKPIQNCMWQVEEKKIISLSILKEHSAKRTKIVEEEEEDSKNRAGCPVDENKIISLIWMRSV